MREDGHEQGIVVPLPCLHMKAEIESMHSSYCHPGGAKCEHKMHPQCLGLRNIYQL